MAFSVSFELIINPIPLSEEPWDIMLTLIFLSPKALKILASTPTFPSKPLPSKLSKETLSFVEIVLIPHEVAYEISDAQGVFLGKPPYKIFLDEEIISDGGMDAVNVLIHEFFHLGFYQYLLKDKEEETIVNSYANFTTELFMRSELKEWLVWQITKSVWVVKLVYLQ